MSSKRALQPLNDANLNKVQGQPLTNINNLKTPVKGSVTKPDATKKKKREKLSSLCKTPPSIVKNRNGRGYRRGHFLGEGGFARCFQMKDDTGRIFAAKTVAKDSVKNEKTRTKLLSEIKIHKSMSHPNIVEFIDCFEDDVNVYILLEICPHQSLMDLLKTRKLLSEAEVRYFMVQIIGAVKYLHRRKVVHRDLKLGNIFFDPEMNLKIGDFGLATIVNTAHPRRYTICGTPNYIAPEVLGGKEVGHSFEVDVWAIGIMMYAMLFGKPPFQAKDVQVIYERIKTNTYTFPTDSVVSLEAKVLIKDLLSTDPAQRPTLDEVLNYEWFKCGSFPPSITTETLKQQPRSFSFITKEESMINFANCKQQVGINDFPKNPVEILKTDLESERPRTLLPHSLSPDNTKNKYKEVAPVNIKPYKSKISNQLSKARFDHKMTTMLNDSLTATLQNMAEIEAGNIHANSNTMQRPELISRWVDYSNKHGFAYQLSNSVGVLFTEGHTVLKFLDRDDVYLIMPDSQQGWKVDYFSPDQVPKSLENEMKVLDFFDKYMKAHLSDVQTDSSLPQTSGVFLRRYTRDDHGIMFELSNGSYQFNFKDHHKIIISEYGYYITHITPQKEIETLPLEYVLERGDFYETHDDYFEVKLNFIKRALKEKLSI